MRFLDAMEEYDPVTGLFSLSPVDRNMSPLRVGAQEIPVTRFAGPEFVASSHRYVRGLLLGRLARLHQLTGEDQEVVPENLGLMVKELLAAGYSVRQLRTALASLRQAWAQPAVVVLRRVLRDLEAE
jgi:hypothetical protein